MVAVSTAVAGYDEGEWAEGDEGYYDEGYYDEEGYGEEGYEEANEGVYDEGVLEADEAYLLQSGDLPSGRQTHQQQKKSNRCLFIALYYKKKGLDKFVADGDGDDEDFYK